MERYCSNCGNLLPEKAMFCPSCGDKVEQENGKHNGKARKAGMAIVLVLVLIIVAVFLFEEKPVQTEKSNLEEPVSSTERCSEEQTVENVSQSSVSEINDEKIAVEEQPTEIFRGYYTNDGKTERSEILQKILDAVEGQLCQSDDLKTGTTHGDIIYYFVENKFDCYPSAEHPVYSVLIDVGETSVFSENSYGIYYIVGLGNGLVLDLVYAVPHYDFQNILLAEVTLRQITGKQRNIFSYWCEEDSKEKMEAALYAFAVQMMPELAVQWEELYEEASVSVDGRIEREDESLSGWKIVLNEPVQVEDSQGPQMCSELYFYDGVKFGEDEPSAYEGNTVTIKGHPENYRDGGDFYLYDPQLLMGSKKMKKEVNTENFEGMVSLERRESWYDNGVFRGFLAEMFAESTGIEYQYIGTAYDAFETTEYGAYNVFDIYRAEVPNKGKTYYLIPHSENFAPPSVYEFVDGVGVRHIWSGAA